MCSFPSQNNICHQRTFPHTTYSYHSISPRHSRRRTQTVFFLPLFSSFPLRPSFVHTPHAHNFVHTRWCVVYTSHFVCIHRCTVATRFVCALFFLSSKMASFFPFLFRPSIFQFFTFRFSSTNFHLAVVLFHTILIVG